jgi:hypothetical protein
MFSRLRLDLRGRERSVEIEATHELDPVLGGRDCGAGLEDRDRRSRLVRPLVGVGFVDVDGAGAEQELAEALVYADLGPLGLDVGERGTEQRGGCQRLPGRRRRVVERRAACSPRTQWWSAARWSPRPSSRPPLGRLRASRATVASIRSRCRFRSRPGARLGWPCNSGTPRRCHGPGPE